MKYGKHLVLILGYVASAACGSAHAMEAQDALLASQEIYVEERLAPHEYVPASGSTSEADPSIRYVEYPIEAKVEIDGRLQAKSTREEFTN